MRARKKDGNQTEIVEWFRLQGCSVAITSRLGDGFPDIVVGYQGFNVLVEIKDGSLPPSKRKLTDDEVEFMEEWLGWYVVVESIADAERVMKAFRALSALHAAGTINS